MTDIVLWLINLTYITDIVGQKVFIYITKEDETISLTTNRPYFYQTHTQITGFQFFDFYV